MDQSAISAYMPLQGQSQPIPQTQAQTLQPTVKRAQCAIPGCGKQFSRKEHLTRHLKSHDQQRQHECPICGRRYARSDVLKRHVEHHSQDSSSSRTLVACTSCHERKLKCDDSIPCRSCTRNSTECSRVGLGREDRMSMGPPNDAENVIGNNIMRENDQMLADEIIESDKMDTVLPGSDSQPSWIQTAQDPWSLPFPDTGLNVSFPDVLDAGGLAQWTNGPSIPATGPEGISLLSPASRESTSRTECLPGDQAPHDMYQIDRTVSSPPLQTPASSSTPSREDHIADLCSCLNKASPVTKRLVQVYFAEIHPYWPILHAPTFDTCEASASHVLVGSMIMLASWLEGEHDHTKLAPLVFDAVNATLLKPKAPSSSDIQPASLHTLQALLLCVVYTIHCLNSQGMLAKAVHFNSILISNCRHLGVFDGQHAYELGPCPIASWLAQEQLHRLAFSVLRVDTYLSVLLGYPPSVRYQEICIPLPKSAHLWTAVSEDERRNLQWNEPAGREKALHCFLMRDALDFDRRSHLPCHLTEADYHFGLCSLQVGIWEAAREAHSCESDELVINSTPKDAVQLWRTHLDLWRVSTERDCLLRQKYFSASTSAADIFSPLSLTLWHLSALMLHAPLKVLQGQDCGFKRCTSTVMTKQKNKARIHTWSKSPDARTAVWNAAQISRVVAHESTNSTRTTFLLHNPVAIFGILKSAIVTCSYAYHTKTCPVCTGGPPIDLVDLFSAKDEDAKLVKWKEHGEGLGDWDPLRMPVCECKVMALATWFRRLLARDKAAELEFTVFLRGLGKG